MPDSYGGYAYGTGEYAGPPVPNSPYVSTNGGAFPFRFLEIAPGYGPNDINPVWVNIASDVTQIQTRRGRQRVLSRFEAGTMTVTIDNKSGKYSPFNPASPYYNLIVPGMPIRFRALWGAVTYAEYSGFVESWPLVWPSANDSTVTVTAVDAMKFLNLKKATSINAYAPAVMADGPYLYWRLGDPSGSTTVADSSGNGRTGTAGTIAAGTDTWFFGAAGALVADTDGAFDSGSATGQVTGTVSLFQNAVSIEVWAQVRSLTVGATSPIAALTASPGTGQQINVGVNTAGLVAVHVDNGLGALTDFTSQFQPDAGWHHYVVTSDGSFVALWIDGKYYGQAVIVASAALNTVTFGGGFGVIDEAALYSYKLTSAQALAHYRAGVLPRQLETTGQRISYLAGYTGIPTANQVIDTGQSTVQRATEKWLTGTILANMQDQTDTEGGALFIDAAGRLTSFDRLHTSRSPYSSVSLVLGDSSAPPEEPYRLDSLTVSYDDQDVYNEITITPDGLAPQTASDTPSQTQYGKRTQASASLTSSIADAAARAAARLALFKTPLPRVDAVTVNPIDDPTMLFGPVLGFDLLTRVQVRRRPKDGSGSTFDQTALIEGIEHKVTKATWETTWRLGVPS